MSSSGILHLTEAERHEAAEASPPGPLPGAVAAHLAACAECAADVARIRSMIERARAIEPPATDLDAIWSGIGDRIERGKLVPLDGPAMPAGGVTPRWVARAAWIAGAIGVVASVLVVARLSGGGGAGTVRIPSPSRAAASTIDSSGAYRRQVTLLLEELELRRALLRPEVASRVDHDLAVIDAAIAELQDALRNDPDNPALRQLLAASYRQKRDLLQRVRDAS
jgi:hypothetical protein